MCIRFSWWHSFCGHSTVSQTLPCISLAPEHAQSYIVRSDSFCKSCDEQRAQGINLGIYNLVTLVGDHQVTDPNQLFKAPLAIFERLSDHIRYVEKYGDQVWVDPVYLNEQIARHIGYRKFLDSDMFLCYGSIFSYTDHCRAVDAYRRMKMLIFYLDELPPQVEPLYLPGKVLTSRERLLATQFANALAWNKSWWDIQEKTTPAGRIRAFFSGKILQFPSRFDELFIESDAMDITDPVYREPAQEMLSLTLEPLAIADLDLDCANCAICHDKLGFQFPDGKLEMPVKLCCPGGHIFGRNCIMNHFMAKRFRCPMCNYDVKKDVGAKAYEVVKNAEYDTPLWLSCLLGLETAQDLPVLPQVYEEDCSLETLL